MENIADMGNETLDVPNIIITASAQIDKEVQRKRHCKTFLDNRMSRLRK